VAYRIRVCIGSLISLACLGLALYALFQLVRGGSCASGGVYVSARQCPPGTEKWAWVLPGAIIGGLLSFFLGTFKGFGPAPEATRTLGGVPRATGGAAPFDPAGFIRGQVIVAGGRVVIPGQVPGSPVDGTDAYADQRDPSTGRADPSGHRGDPSVDDRDPIVRLFRLRELLDAGTLSPAEFELAKAKILNEM
jgi:hypothetical protein